jgi:outer membrane protein TolC
MCKVQKLQFTIFISLACILHSTLSLCTRKFEAGAGSNTEISAAQADLVTAQNNFMNALYAALIAKVDLLKASGKL